MWATTCLNIEILSALFSTLKMLTIAYPNADYLFIKI